MELAGRCLGIMKDELKIKKGEIQSPLALRLRIILRGATRWSARCTHDRHFGAAKLRQGDPAGPPPPFICGHR